MQKCAARNCCVSSAAQIGAAGGAAGGSARVAGWRLGCRGIVHCAPRPAPRPPRGKGSRPDRRLPDVQTAAYFLHHYNINKALRVPNLLYEEELRMRKSGFYLNFL